MQKALATAPPRQHFGFLFQAHLVQLLCIATPWTLATIRTIPESSQHACGDGAESGR